MGAILLVEDDHQLRPLIASALGEAGYHAVPAGTVSEAMSLVEQHDFCLAIIDLKLPNGYGMEIVAQIYQQIDVIILTGYPSHAARNEAATYGVVAFLEKPFDEEELVTVVDQVIEQETLSIALDTTHPRSGGRHLGDSVDINRIYQKLATVSSRVNRALAMKPEIAAVKSEVGKVKAHIQKQNGAIMKIESHIDTVLNRTDKCEERGEAIAVLQEKARMSGLNWERVVQVILTLITAGAAVFVTRAANTLAEAISNAP